MDRPSKFAIVLPNGDLFQFQKTRPVVMLGANGTGKSRLGAQIDALARQQGVPVLCLRPRTALRPCVEDCIADGSHSRPVRSLWQEVFPGRPVLPCPKLSDGERVILHTISSGLDAPHEALLIVDAPEDHIHKSILPRVWSVLEEARRDCAFLYITHDMDFAVSRNPDDVIWLKDYDGGTGWSYEHLSLPDYPSLSPSVLLEILGSRRKTLLVEGERNSLDYQLYRELYRDAGYHVIPVGGCQDVIASIKAKNASPRLDGLTVVGLVDRDHRSDTDLDRLAQAGVYALQVAEVENLFVVPEILSLMATQLGCAAGTFEKATNVVRDHYRTAKNRQVTDAVRQDVVDRVKRAGHKLRDPEPGALVARLIEALSPEALGDLVRRREADFPETDDVRTIARVLNDKSLVTRVGEAMDVKGREYPNKVINLLRRKDVDIRSRLMAAFRPYIPELP